jgi:hypothetical protein
MKRIPDLANPTWVLLAVAAAALGAPAAAQSGYPQSSGQARVCAPAGAVAAGALLGALGGRAPWPRGGPRGALAGGVLGSAACRGFNGREQAAAAPRPPDAAGLTVTAYRTGAQRDSYPPGSEVVIESAIGVAWPPESARRDLVEDYAISAPDGHLKHFAKRIANPDDEIRNTLTMDLPIALPHGVYVVTTTLLVDGRPQARNRFQFRIG